MPRFLKLTHCLINANHIQSIIIEPNKYLIQIMSNKIHGSGWILAGSGGGNISSHNSELKVCKTEHPNDYKIVSDWIDKY